MSTTPIQVATDLKEILDQINQKLDNLAQNVADIRQKDLVELKVGQARLEEKVDGLAKRVESQEFISRCVLIGLIVAILGGFAKLFGLVGNPEKLRLFRFEFCPACGALGNFEFRVLLPQLRRLAVLLLRFHS